MTSLLAERLPVSLQLAAAGDDLRAAGLDPARRDRGAEAQQLDRLSLYRLHGAGFAMPNFGLALILIYVFSIQLDWLPITGIGSAEAAAAGYGPI